jgi:uncharacterized protein
MIPSFKTGNYEEGIRAGVTVLSGFLRGAYGLRQTEFKPQIEISILHLVLAILMVGVSFPSMLILYFVSEVLNPAIKLHKTSILQMLN